VFLLFCNWLSKLLERALCGATLCLWPRWRNTLSMSFYNVFWVFLLVMPSGPLVEYGVLLYSGTPYIDGIPLHDCSGTRTTRPRMCAASIAGYVPWRSALRAWST
jgi:hypothetical protein